MTDQAEYRGWEIEDNYREHFLDDPDVDLTDFSEGNSGYFVASMVILLVAIVGLYALNLWLKPPMVTFQPVTPPIIQHDAPKSFWAQVDNTWRVSCVYGNIKAKTLRPNYENPNCAPEAAKKRGEW